MDVYSNYNEIQMHPKDKEKMVFCIRNAIYCYKIMLFGLKNADATYLRLITKLFAVQIGTTMERRTMMA